MRLPQSLCSLALVTVTAAATLFLIQACGGGAFASDDDRDPIVGAWDGSVTVKDCTSGASSATFKSLLLFHHGGTVNVDTSTVPSVRLNIFGTWTRGQGNRYTADVSHFRYAADGTLAGINKIQRTVELNNGATAFTANLRVRVFNNDGVLLSEVCPTETATRVTF